MSERKTLTVTVDVNKPWRKNDGESHEGCAQFIDPLGWFRADVRFDGCIHFNRYYNRPYDAKKEPRHDDVGYIHICDVDDLIVRLVALRDEAKKHFGEGWPR